MADMVYYKRNVGYTVIVRRFVGDSNGVSLNGLTPTIAIPANELRDFKLANKRTILEGLIVPADEPEIDWETPNALTDEDINNLLKNIPKLRKALQTIDSVSTLSRMLEAAKVQDKSEKVKQAIRERWEELGEEGNLSPGEMISVT